PSTFAASEPTARVAGRPLYRAYRITEDLIGVAVSSERKHGVKRRGDMPKVLLLVTWLVSGQPPSSYQLSFDSAAPCEAAREAVLAEGKRLAIQSQQKPAGIPANSFYNPGPPPMVSAVC